MSGNVSSQNQRNFQLEVGSNIRRPTDRFTVDSSRNMSSPRVQVFELDNTKSSRSFGTSSEAYVVQPAPGDVEYGITVTKVVETLSDPMPASEWR
ncbi:hypothetical protein VKT23_002742 [Stygiomarasmius scandens]|uniref:Uncharacterized protein n=1 Tax=Marasmiellus scandens TaxID=2682957 RepID=A0ABR1JVY3_9AGAR